VIDQTLSALSDPTRRQVVELLGERPHRASELADAVGTSRQAMSRHLRTLRTSGLAVEAADPDDGRARIYTLQRAPLTELRGWLDQVETFWTGQLAAFAAHIQARQATPDAPPEES